MYILSERCKNLRDLAVDVKPLSPRISGIRNFYFRKGVAEYKGNNASNRILQAAGQSCVIKNAPAIIQDDELIVGYNYGDGDYEHLRIGEERVRKLKSTGFSDEEIDWFVNESEKIYGRFSYIEKDCSLLDRKDMLMEDELASTGFCLSENHSVIGYDKVIKLGFEGLKEKVEEYREKNGDNDLYQAMIMICDAACEFGEKYSVEAAKLAEKCSDEKRKKELLKIAEVCSVVPRKPATNFIEAVQSLFFAHCFNTWEDGVNANSIGRLDQILYPYYKNDIENGVITKEQAFEIICCLWIKLYRDYDVQQSCIGGTDINGNNVENELSYMMLDATEKLDFIRCLSVRFSSKSDRKFLRRALEVVGNVKKGVPFFFNDDVLIPALVNAGIEKEDAVDYTQIGCVETVIPGKSNPHAVTGRFNVLKGIEYALTNGWSNWDKDAFCGLETGDPSEFDTYDKLKDAVYSQIRHITESACKKVVCDLKRGAVHHPSPYKSLLTEGCMESGKDITDRGAKYDYYQMCIVGIPNLADSLLAMKKLVYEGKQYTVNEIVYQLNNNFPDEAIRLDLVNKAPKYGNDIDEVDSCAVEITNYCCDILEEMSEKYGISFHAQPFSYIWMIDHGEKTGATPDGRRCGDILAYSVSPMQGRDWNGFTSLMNSLSKLPTKRTPATTSAIVEVDDMLFNEKNIDIFVEIMLESAKKGLSNVQFNTINADTLIDAQANPDKHKNLAVRVSGFSQKFYLLDKKMQDHIIARTKHTSI